MPLPVIAGAAAAVAARLAAKKAAQELTKKAVKKTAAKVVSNNVKVLPRKTAPKTDLSNRGAKLNQTERRERAREYQFDTALGKVYRNNDRIATTNPLPRSERGPGASSLRKAAAIKKEATIKKGTKPVVKINSAPKNTADSARAANAKALKAANKPVSKGNRNIGGPVVRNIIKNSPPARANRTRLGNPAKKK